MSEWAVYPSLKERSVLVTGGGSGIGAQMVRRFCEQGSRVAFLDLAREPSEALVAEIEAAGHGRPLFLACDLRDIAALRRAVAEAAEADGPVTALINNAARNNRHPWDKGTPEYWADRLATNLRHQCVASQAGQA